MKIGIIGLPNVGKSTLFQALTKIKVDTSNYPFATINPNVGIVPTNDERLSQIAAAAGSQKIYPDVIEFFDVAGLIKGAHKGEGLGNQFLSQLFPMDGLVEVVRIFKDEKIAYVGEGEENKDIEIIAEELRKKDEEIKERAKGKKETSGLPPKLSEKPIIYLYNAKDGKLPKNPKEPSIVIDAKLEDELKELPPEEQKEYRTNSSTDDLIALILKTLDQITVFTANKNEARSWLHPRGADLLRAASKIHTDFVEKFIRAEVVDWRDFISLGGWQGARKAGKARAEGKNYKIKDGEVIEIKI